MAGLANIGNEQGRLVTIQTPMPEDLDGVLDEVRKILMLGSVQTITLRLGEPIVYQRVARPDEEVSPEDSTSAFTELTLMDVVRNIHMEEFNVEEEGSRSPYEQVLQMVLRMSEDGWVMTHILTSESSNFWKWVGITPPQKRRLAQFLGARMETDLTLPADVFILCGSVSRGASIAEVCCALKGNVR